MFHLVLVTELCQWVPTQLETYLALATSTLMREKSFL